ncbi:RNA-binding domain-containing protein [Lentinula edodes]|uniref:RNA-binding domain-containing protein n=1 Tax=Lentinula edodes TaxID=5353 RepID=A0A1Q3DY47_LENED|nr:RNA-binding domain-containing protein [Lentinula edodes]
MSAFRAQRGGNKPYSRPPRGDLNGQWLHDKAPGMKNTNTDSRPRGPSDIVEQSNTKLLVSNLHYEVTPKDLAAIFGQIGTLVREPLIRYDRSGRSTGNAIVFYETAAEATKGKKTFDGVLAKGQPMTITFDTGGPRQSRRAVSAPHSSLINRIQKPPLADRLSSDDIQVKDSAGPGPTRTRPSRRGGRGMPRGGATTQRPDPRPKVSKQPKTAEDLDKELDAFMGDAESAPIAGASVEAQSLVADSAIGAVGEQDVEMA